MLRMGNKWTFTLCCGIKELYTHLENTLGLKLDLYLLSIKEFHSKYLLKRNETMCSHRLIFLFCEFYSQKQTANKLPVHQVLNEKAN